MEGTDPFAKKGRVGHSPTRTDLKEHNKEDHLEETDTDRETGRETKPKGRMETNETIKPTIIEGTILFVSQDEVEVRNKKLAEQREQISETPRKEEQQDESQTNPTQPGNTEANPRKTMNTPTLQPLRRSSRINSITNEESTTNLKEPKRQLRRSRRSSSIVGRNDPITDVEEFDEITTRMNLSNRDRLRRTYQELEAAAERNREEINRVTKQLEEIKNEHKNTQEILQNERQQHKEITARKEEEIQKLEKINSQRELIGETVQNQERLNKEIHMLKEELEAANEANAKRVQEWQEERSKLLEKIAEKETQIQILDEQTRTKDPPTREEKGTNTSGEPIVFQGKETQELILKQIKELLAPLKDKIDGFGISVTNVETRLTELEMRKDSPADDHTTSARPLATSGSNKTHQKDKAPTTRATDQSQDNMNNKQETNSSMPGKRLAIAKNSQREQYLAQRSRPTPQVSEPRPKPPQQTNEMSHGNNEDEQQPATSEDYDKHYPALGQRENVKTKTYALAAGIKPTKDCTDPQNKTQTTIADLKKIISNKGKAAPRILN